MGEVYKTRKKRKKKIIRTETGEEKKRLPSRDTGLPELQKKVITPDN